MYNFDGRCYTELSAVPASVLERLWEGPILQTDWRIEKRAPLLLEATYFALMAQLRRLRVQIPLSYTMEFWDEQLRQTLSQDPTQKSFIARIAFYRTAAIAQDRPNSTLSFGIQIHPCDSLVDSVGTGATVELFKDYYISSDPSSNLYGAHQRHRDWARVFAFENGFDNCFLLNTQKEVVATAQGCCYLIQGQTISTPLLSSGVEQSVIRTVFNEWLAQQAEFQFQEAAISPFDLQKADEVFALSLEHGLEPVGQYRKTSYGNTQSQALFEAFVQTLF